MYWNAARQMDHAGFTRTIDAGYRRRHARVSVMVVATLALAIMASLVALRLNEAEGLTAHRAMSAAWNTDAARPVTLSRGG